MFRYGNAVNFLNLGRAAAAGHLEVVKYLVDRNDYGQFDFLYALNQGVLERHSDVVKYLKEQMKKTKGESNV